MSRPRVRVIDATRFEGYHVLHTMWADKKWGAGRTRQLLQRFLCSQRGHNAGPWGDREEGVRMRRCIDGCGWVQTEREDLVGARRVAR